MRIPINLATQPYEEIRRFQARWRLVLVISVLAVIALVGYAVFTWMTARNVAHDLEKLRAQEAQLAAQKKHAQNVMDEPQNRSVRDTSQLLNSLIARKAAFSWTIVLSDLEKLMPSRVRVLSIKPAIQGNLLTIQLRVQGESHESISGPDGLLRRMEHSDRFRDPQIKAEGMDQASKNPGAIPTVTFDISATYVPPLMRPAPPAAGEGGAR